MNAIHSFGVVSLVATLVVGCSVDADATLTRDDALTQAASSSFYQPAPGEAPTATLVFDVGSDTPRVEGKLTPGANFRIQYDYTRLLSTHPECLFKAGEGSYGAVEAALQVNHEPSSIRYVAVSGYGFDGNPRRELRTDFKLPTRAVSLTLWFRCVGPSNATA